LLIGVISDTHEEKLSTVEKFIEKNLKELDLLIHVGDYTSFKVLELFNSRFKFLGVQGNNDDFNIKHKLREKEVLLICNYKIGLYHGHGSGKTTIERALEAFKDSSVDIIIFGHSHMPLIQTKNKVLLINPGSPLAKRREHWYSFVILQIEKDNIDIKLKMFENKPI
jgi:uncharacterized protein